MEMVVAVQELFGYYVPDAVVVAAVVDVVV